MTTPSLMNIITHNSTKAITKCYKKRPCYRPTCYDCIARRRSFIVEQLFPKMDELMLDQHLVVTIPGFKGTFSQAFELLFQLRAPFLRKLSKIAPVFCCLSVVESSANQNRVVPHFHLLCSEEIAKEMVRTIFLESWGMEVNMSSTAFGKTKKDLKNLIGYWLEQNLKPSAPNKPKHKRLLTGPRGILLGRPKYHFAPEEFRLLEEMTNEKL